MYFSLVEMAKAYLKYRRKAKTRHGIHSPFVYTLVEKVFRKRDWHKSEDIKKLRKELLQSNEEIKINDLGAGSRVDNNALRSVGKIAKVSSTSLKNAGMLQRLADFMGCENILELGTNLGLTTAALAAAKSTTKLISIEGDPKLAALSRKNLAQLELGAEIVTGSIGKKMPNGTTIESVSQTTEYLLTEAGLALVPFTAFGAKADNPWYRLSVGTTNEKDIPLVINKLRASIVALS